MGLQAVSTACNMKRRLGHDTVTARDPAAKAESTKRERVDSDRGSSMSRVVRGKSLERKEEGEGGKEERNKGGEREERAERDRGERRGDVRLGSDLRVGGRVEGRGEADGRVEKKSNNPWSARKNQSNFLQGVSSSGKLVKSRQDDLRGNFKTSWAGTALEGSSDAKAEPAAEGPGNKETDIDALRPKIERAFAVTVAGLSSAGGGSGFPARARRGSTLARRKRVESLWRRTRRGCLVKEVRRVALVASFPCGIKQCSAPACQRSNAQSTLLSRKGLRKGEEGEEGRRKRKSHHHIKRKATSRIRPIELIPCAVTPRSGRKGVAVNVGEEREPCKYRLNIIDESVLRNQTDMLFRDPALNHAVVCESHLMALRQDAMSVYRKFMRLLDLEDVSPGEDKLARRGALKTEDYSSVAGRHFYVFPDTFVDLPPKDRACEDVGAVSEGRVSVHDGGGERVMRVALWYAIHLQSSGLAVDISVITERSEESCLDYQGKTDQGGASELMSLFKSFGIRLTSLRDFVEASKPLFPSAGEHLALTEKDATATNFCRRVFPRHMARDALMPMLLAGEAAVAIFRASDYSCWEGSVFVGRREQKSQAAATGKGLDENVDLRALNVDDNESNRREIRLLSPRNINRALDGDRVVVRFLEPQILTAEVFKRRREGQLSSRTDRLLLDDLLALDALSHYESLLQTATTSGFASGGGKPAGVAKTSGGAKASGSVSVSVSQVSVQASESLMRLAFSETPPALSYEEARSKIFGRSASGGACAFGRVVGVVQRNVREYCGTIPPSEAVGSADLPEAGVGREGGEGGEFVRIIPCSAKLPDVLIKRPSSLSELIEKRLIFVLDAWPRTSTLPLGHWTENLGPAGSKETESQVLLREYKVITGPFSAAALNSLPPEDYTIPKSELEKRLDIRPRFCFCEFCRASRAGRRLDGADDAILAPLLGTPCIHTRDLKRESPLKTWNERSPCSRDPMLRVNDPEAVPSPTPKALPNYNDVLSLREARGEWEEFELGDPLLANGTLCVSIDPPTCVDIDDALSVRFTRNGNFEIGVHIADVSHFVRPNSPLDAEAAERCTTVYLVDRRTDMLPARLSADLCSLRAGQDRLTFSVFWEMTPDAKILSTRFHRTVTHSVAALSYKQAQSMIDDRTDRSPVTVRLRVLNDLAKKLKKNRLEKGALELHSAELKFAFAPKLRSGSKTVATGGSDVGSRGRGGEKKKDGEEDGVVAGFGEDPISMAPYEWHETNFLIEEFMLLANIAVATKIVDAFPESAVLRRHPPPKEEGLALLAEVLKTKKNIGNFAYGSSLELAASLNAAVDPHDASFNTFLRELVVQYMNQAVYFCSGQVRDENGRRHYALASDLYTHFTSPIRRYADILVHRLLAAAINDESLPSDMSRTRFVAQLCDRASQRHRNAQLCSRASQEFFALLHYKGLAIKASSTLSADSLDEDSLIAQGTVTQVRPSGCLVSTATGTHFAKVDAGRFTFDPTSTTFKRNASRSTKANSTAGSADIEVFSKVRVVVNINSTNYRYTITYNILDTL